MIMYSIALATQRVSDGHNCIQQGTTTCLVTVDPLVEAEARMTQFIYLVGVLNVVAYLVVDYSGRVDQPILDQSANNEGNGRAGVPCQGEVDLHVNSMRISCNVVKPDKPGQAVVWVDMAHRPTCRHPAHFSYSPRSRTRMASHWACKNAKHDAKRHTTRPTLTNSDWGHQQSGL